MATRKSETTRQAEFVAAAEGMYERLRAWRAAHPEASFDEIGDEVTRERQQLMAQLLGELAGQPEEVTGAEPELCATCGEALTAKGKRERGVSHREGEVRLAREYHYCESCHSGLFPPGPSAAPDAPRLEPADD
jgi:hypothetical protein